METTWRDCILFLNALAKITSFGKLEKKSDSIFPRNGTKVCLFLSECNDAKLSIPQEQKKERERRKK
jgi:hypothetical protein